MKIFFIIIIIAIVIPCTMMIQASSKDLNIMIVYNNLPFSRNVTCAWGMGCVIRGFDHTILFDTGGDGNILLSNMRKINIDPQEIDMVVLSHIHGDHTGGLWRFLEVNADVTVYLPSSFPGNFKQRVYQMGAKYVEIGKPVEIMPDVFSTGELGTWIKEQALVLRTDKGLIIITGCSHPGIVSIAKRAVEVVQDKIYLITGGFHLGGTSKREIDNIIKELKAIGVEKIGPSHCTGQQAIESFRNAWGKNFIDGGCGANIQIRR